MRDSWVVSFGLGFHFGFCAGFLSDFASRARLCLATEAPFLRKKDLPEEGEADSIQSAGAHGLLSFDPVESPFCDWLCGSVEGELGVSEVE